MQRVLDDWTFYAPQLHDLYDALNQGRAQHVFVQRERLHGAAAARIPVGRRFGVCKSRRTRAARAAPRCRRNSGPICSCIRAAATTSSGRKTTWCAHPKRSASTSRQKLQ
ncbi:MAG: Fumarylacetoacetate hydrolase family protein [uncultured Paraburkholderia sp.]|nr:MAG: Fumarylacetoacetate hydrolase family protein [uncultured Paraburkholderia sp.]